MKLPSQSVLAKLLVQLKADIGDEYRAYDEDETPGMLVTVGADDKGNWAYQTGDNSYTGGAYLYPHWGVIALYRDSNCKDLAKDIQYQISEAQSC